MPRNSGFTFKDNSDQVINLMNDNVTKSLTAIGQTIVEITTDYMEHKYGKAIRITGDLIRSISFNINMADKSVTIGSNLNYSSWVHNGTSKMSARPFLRDAIMENIKIIEEVAAEYLGDGFRISVSF